MALLKEFVLSLNKRSTTLDFLLSNYPQVLQYFMTNPLDMIFGDFGIRLLGYEIEFSCLYIPKGLYFISTLWL